MYYHIRIDYYDNRLKANRTLFDLDKESLEAVITDCVESYMRQNDFFFKGAKLSPASIVQMQVYSTEYTMQQCIETEDKTSAEISFGIPTTEVDILEDSNYSKNVTNEIIKLTEQYIYDMDHPDTFRQQVIQPKNKQSATMTAKTPMVFISHKHDDLTFVTKLCDLLEDIGLNHTNLFCSSVPELWIGLGEDIFDSIKKLFQEHDLYVIFVQSPRYYKSPVSLNEMGAAWILKSKCRSILTSDMEYSMMAGVVNDSKTSIKVNTADAKYRMNEMKDEILTFLNLPDVNGNRWERKRDQFLDDVCKIPVPLTDEQVVEIIKETKPMIAKTYGAPVPIAPNQNPSAYLRGTDSSKDKVFACITKNPSISKQDIAKKLHLSKDTVERCLSELARDGIIIKSSNRNI